ncbi:MAG: hypothetical protein OXU64_01605 [Gemmatimonadota bacterium]|nr:hypothetical protein [Gemmatimonadota bacterium]
MTRLSSSPAPPSPDARPGGIRKSSRCAGRFLVAVAAAALVACDDPYAPERSRVVGTWGGLVQIPDTMTVGVPSEIVFLTRGNCRSGGPTEVVITGRWALVIPYDYLDLDGADPAPCGILLYGRFEHRAEVVFNDPGTAEILIAYKGDGGYGYRDYIVEVVR